MSQAIRFMMRFREEMGELSGHEPNIPANGQ